MVKVNPPTLLLVHDGWGYGNFGQKGNAIEAAETPCMTDLEKDPKNAFTTINASGLSVGLVDGLMGNSEVG
jgi:2,3-bisphosphoglycerate-independent phosphoglycerate mutase